MLLFASVVNIVIMHVNGCKSCDHFVLLCVVCMLKICIINVVIEYLNGYKCCGLCHKCCNLKIACF